MNPDIIRALTIAAVVTTSATVLVGAIALRAQLSGRTVALRRTWWATLILGMLSAMVSVGSFLLVVFLWVGAGVLSGAFFFDAAGFTTSFFDVAQAEVRVQLAGMAAAFALMVVAFSTRRIVLGPKKPSPPPPPLHQTFGRQPTAGQTRAIPPPPAQQRPSASPPN